MYRDHESDADEPAGEAGQTMVEYAAVLAVITIAILLTIQLIGDSSGALFMKVVRILS
ncbi:MAG: hypothetical protein JWN72_1205 [Thermoleophilia bacterium]|nr:hypothetical protein [Thermoleophilia bacterium]